MALSVERMCASWPGCAPKAPFWSFSRVGHARRAEKERSMRFVRTCLVVPAAHHILYRLLRIQRLLVFHYAKRGEAPVDRVHAQVRRHVVGQVILILRGTLFSREDLVRLEDNSTTYFP